MVSLGLLIVHSPLTRQHCVGGRRIILRADQSAARRQRHMAARLAHRRGRERRVVVHRSGSTTPSPNASENTVGAESSARRWRR